jgi:hypothetical protein
VVVNEVLSRLDGDFAKAYAIRGQPSIAPERLLRALLLQAFYTIRSERQLMEQLDYNLLYRWFVGLGVDEAVWVPTVARGAGHGGAQRRLCKGAVASAVPTQQPSSEDGPSVVRGL